MINTLETECLGMLEHARLRILGKNVRPIHRQREAVSGPPAQNAGWPFVEPFVDGSDRCFQTYGDTCVPTCPDMLVPSCQDVIPNLFLRYTNRKQFVGRHSGVDCDMRALHKRPYKTGAKHHLHHLHQLLKNPMEDCLEKEGVL